ncbi:hypothetical protein AAGR22_21840 (plasmid) [Erwinia sp. HDF1-3R]|uniref:hypothetical protein n=1 Tax=Erwiniaceae TaxID=1903409 RepID=UPI0031F55712
MNNQENLNGKGLHTEELPSSTENSKINDLTENDGCSNVKDGNGSVMAEVKTVKENGNIDNDVKSNFDDSHSINKGCNQDCNCCKKNDKTEKKDPLNGWWVILMIFASLCYCSFAIPIWNGAEEATWWLTFVGLGTLFISLCAYCYDEFFNTKKANSLLRSLKVLGDVGAAIIVFGTFRQLAVDWGDFGKYFASALTVIILFLTACKTKNDI